MNTPENTYSILRKSLLKAQSDGLMILDGAFGNGKSCCCAITAHCRRGIDEGEGFNGAAEAIGITPTEAWHLIGGFDDNGDFPDKPLYAVGQRLRAEFIEGRE